QVPVTHEVAARLQRQEVVCSPDGDAGNGTIWVPASERGQVYGCIAVLNGQLDAALDTQHLATIGAEFGVAFEDQRRFEEAYRNEARFRSLVHNSSESVTVVDANGVIRYHSPAARRVFGDDPESLVGMPWTDLLHPAELARGRAFLAEVASQPGSTSGREWQR